MSLFKAITHLLSSRYLWLALQVDVEALPPGYDQSAVTARQYCIDPKGPLSKILYKNQNYTFKIQQGSWDSPKPVAMLMSILIEEQIGIETEISTNYFGSQGILASLAGCESTMNPQQCKNFQSKHDPPTAWASPDVWISTANEEELASAQFTQGLGEIGFTTYPGLYTYPRVVATASQHMYMLEWWETLKLNGVMKFFTEYTVLDAKIRTMATDASTGQLAYQPGCHPSDAWWAAFPANYSTRCIGGWFIAPACSSDTSKCIPVILWEFVWNAVAWALNAETHGLPLAITWLGAAGAGSNVIPQLANSNYSFLFYWWGTDRTFSFTPLPVRVSFAVGRTPPMLRIKEFQKTWKVVWKKLVRENQDIFDLWSGVTLVDTDIRGLLDEVSNGTSLYHAACSWLHSNEFKWRTWLKNESDCIEGTYYKPSAPRLQRCVSCPKGTYADRRALTTCKQCLPGAYVDTVRSTACNTCNPGEFSNDTGGESCKLCEKGFYQPNFSATTCAPCPGAFETTTNTKSTHPSNCVCRAGWYRPLHKSECAECPSGMTCDLGSSELGFSFSGNVSATVPLLKRGYWSSLEEPMLTFECEDNSPSSPCEGGRPPGGCSDDRIGIVCADCPNDKMMNNNMCLACGPVISFVFILFLIVILVGPLLLFPCLRPRHTWKVNATQALLTTVEILLEMGQTVASLALLRINWPEIGRIAMDIVAGIPFDFYFVDPTSAFSCLVPSSVKTNFTRYLSIMLLIPGISAYFWALYPFCSRLLPQRMKWNLHETIHTISKLVNLVFISQVFISVVPFQCYAHPSPNTKQSVQRFPSTFCWSDEHVNMLVGGIASWLFCIAFFSYLCFETMQIRKKLTSFTDQATLELYVKRITFIIEDFKMETYYWNLVAKFAEFCLGGIVSVLIPDLRIQIFIYIVVSSCCLLLWSKCFPYKLPLLNLAATLVFAIMIIILVVGTTELAAASSAEKQFANVVFNVSLVSVFAMMLLLLIIACVTVYIQGGDGELLCISHLGFMPNVAEILRRWHVARLWTSEDLRMALNSWQAHDIARLYVCLDGLGLAPNYHKSKSRLELGAAVTDQHFFEEQMGIRRSISSMSEQEDPRPDSSQVSLTSTSKPSENHSPLGMSAVNVENGMASKSQDTDGTLVVPHDEDYMDDESKDIPSDFHATPSVCFISAKTVTTPRTLPCSPYCTPRGATTPRTSMLETPRMPGQQPMFVATPRVTPRSPGAEGSARARPRTPRHTPRQSGSLEPRFKTLPN